MKYLLSRIPLVILVYVSLPVFATPSYSGDQEYSDPDFIESISGVNPDCPEWILDNQVLLEVAYWGFDGNIHIGRLVVDDRVVEDLQLVFAQMLLLEFPLESVIPINQFGWDDDLSMRCNNTSGFNYRCVAGTGRLSRHAYGLAVDINPMQNPYYNGDRVEPEGAVYDPSMPGTLYPEHPVVLLFKALGWRWGGDWNEKDYQHFDKQLEEVELNGVEHIRSLHPGGYYEEYS